jgi:hypothetical protein
VGLSSDFSGNLQYQVGVGFGAGIGIGATFGHEAGASYDINGSGGAIGASAGIDQHGNGAVGLNYGPGTPFSVLIGPSYSGLVMTSEEWDLAIKEGEYQRELAKAGAAGIGDTYDPLAIFQDLQSHEGGRALHTQIGPHDPNELFGPGGFGAQEFIQPKGLLPYVVYFENDPKALAPAQNVVVTEQLDPNLDWSTFQLGSFGFGDVTVDVPAGRQFFSTRLDERATLGLSVDVTAGLDAATGVVTWTFESIDPATLDTPADPFSGFLPPDTNSHIGQGFGTYFIKPKAATATGTVIDAQASVVFDTEAAMATALVDQHDRCRRPVQQRRRLARHDDEPEFHAKLERYGRCRWLRYRGLRHLRVR